MTGQTCPKCGSDRVFNGECHKCGILLSKFTNTEPLPAAPRYSATDTPIRSVIEDAAAHHARMRRSRMQTRLIGTGILLFLLLGGMGLYRFITRQAAAYGGVYKNTSHVFGLAFPDQGWSHYSESEVNDFGVAGIADAFWRGSNPDHPDVLLLVHRGDPGVPYPDPYEGEAVDKLEAATTEHLQQLLENAGYQCKFTSTERVGLPGSRGFVYDADLTKEDKQLQARIYCGFRHGGGLYAVLFIATPEQLQANEEELEKIGKSLNFHISPL